MDKVDAARNGGGKADAVIRAEDVVIHRLGDRNDLQTFAVQMRAEGKCPISPDRDHGIDTEMFHHTKDMRRAIDHPVG